MTAIHAISKWYRTVYIPWLATSYDTHKGMRWLNSDPPNHRGTIGIFLITMGFFVFSHVNLESSDGNMLCLAICDTHHYRIFKEGWINGFLYIITFSVQWIQKKYRKVNHSMQQFASFAFKRFFQRAYIKKVTFWG